jgi:hypothetical protein
MANFSPIYTDDTIDKEETYLLSIFNLKQAIQWSKMVQNYKVTDVYVKTFTGVFIKLQLARWIKSSKCF